MCLCVGLYVDRFSNVCNLIACAVMRIHIRKPLRGVCVCTLLTCMCVCVHVCVRVCRFWRQWPF